MNYQQQVEHYRAVRMRLANSAKKQPVEQKSVTAVPNTEEIKEVVVPQWYLDIPKDPKREILRSVANEFGITVADIRGCSRKNLVKQARWKAAWLLHKRGTMSLTAIGKCLNKDHSTILHALKNYRPQTEEDGNVEGGTR